VQTLDDHPVLAALIAWGILTAGLVTWAEVADGPQLLGRAGVEHRTAIYGQVTSTSVALLAVSLTVLSILVALPDNPRVAELRALTGWRILQTMLLVAALIWLVALGASLLGGSIDRDMKNPMEWLEQLMLAACIAGVLTVLFAGIAFSLLLHAIANPPDPSVGRGRG
jgi:hypothetical protein